MVFHNILALLHGADYNHYTFSMLLPLALQALLLLALSHFPSPISCGRFTATLHKSSSSKSGGSKAKVKSRKTRISVGGHGTTASAFIIIAIIIAVIVIVIVAHWWCQRRRTRRYIKETEKLATRKYSVGVQTRDIGEPVRLFSHAEVKRATNGFAADRVLGRGRFGDVYKGILDDETEVAIKSVKTSSIKGKDQVLSEVHSLSKVSHPNLVRLLGFCVRWKRLLLVYEYVPNGSLSHQLAAHCKDTDATVLDWKARLQVALQSAEAMARLHSEGPIYHGDVKSNNILLDQSMNAKVSDYGLTRFVGRKSAYKFVQFSRKWPWINMIGAMSVYKSPAGAFEQPQLEAAYLDPEDQKNNTNELTDKSDVYNFGMLLLELVTSQGSAALRPDSSEHEENMNLVETVKVKKEQGKVDDVLDTELLRVAATEGAALQSMRAVVDLALECLNENGLSRPLMEEVANSLRRIMSSLREPQH